MVDKELDALYRYYSGKDMSRLEAIATDRGFDLSTVEGRRQAAGELAAQFAEKGKIGLYVRQMIAKIKAWLRAVGIATEFGDAEVAAIIRQAIERVTESEGTGGYLLNPAYSVDNNGTFDMMKQKEGGDHIGSHKTSDKRILSPATIKGIRESIESLQDFFGASNRTDQVYSGTDRKRQDKLALEWAQQNNLPIIKEQDFLDKWVSTGKIRGGENRVYFKQNSDGSTWAIKMNELTYHQGNMAAFADRLLKSSEYFPDATLEVIGMVETPRGVKPLLRQPFVVTNIKRLAHPVAIRETLSNMGFRLLDPDNQIWLSPDHSYYLSDPGENNVLADENEVLRFIDVLFHRITSENLRKDYPKIAEELAKEQAAPPPSTTPSATPSTLQSRHSATTSPAAWLKTSGKY